MGKLQKYGKKIQEEQLKIAKKLPKYHLNYYSPIRAPKYEKLRTFKPKISVTKV